MVSPKLTVVPQIARISSGSSSDGAAGAENVGPEETGGWPGRSEFMSSLKRSSLFVVGGRLRVLRLDGVRLKVEWMSPRLFFGVFEGLLQRMSTPQFMKYLGTSIRGEIDRV